MKKVGILLFCLLGSIQVFGVDYFLHTDYGTSAKTIGIGNVEGFNESSAVIFENPAGLHSVDHISFSGFHTTYIAGSVDFYSLALAYKTKVGTFGFGLFEHSVPNIKRTTEDNNGEYGYSDSFSNRNGVYKFSYGKQLSKNTFGGTNLSYYYNEVDTTSGTGFNIDTGLYFDFHTLGVSLVAKNLIPKFEVSYSNGKAESLPLQLAIGLNKHYQDIDLYVQAKLQDPDDPYQFSFGSKYQPEYLNNIFYVSMGWQQFLVVGNSYDKVTLGVGLELLGLTFHVAYEDSSFYESDQQYYSSISVKL